MKTEQIAYCDKFVKASGEFACCHIAQSLRAFFVLSCASDSDCLRSFACLLLI